MSALAATALALTLAPLCAHAGDRKAKPAPDRPATTAPAPLPPPAVAPPTPVKAPPQERLMAQRLDPLARAAFWGTEVQRDGSDVEAAVSFSQALRTMGRLDEALENAQRAVVVAPANLPALLELARVHIARGQGFYAVDPLRKAQAAAPKDWRPPSLLGVALEQASRDEEALAAHKQAVALAPNNPSALANLGLFYAGHDDAPQAEKLLRQAAAQPGAEISVRQNLALVLGLQGKFDEAERLARQDLPPEIVANNMAYLRAASSAGGASSAPASRSWDAMRSAQ